MIVGRPPCLIVVLGTATEVGKTWVTTRLLELLRSKDKSVGARKPAQSFDPPGRRLPLPTDADLLAAASGASAEAVCPPHRWYPLAMAPPMAAEALGAPPVLIDELIAELTWPGGVDVGFVETAGGVGSPLAVDADCARFAMMLRPDLAILVADAGLGTIGAVRLALGALASLQCVVFLNRFDPANELHRRNRDWLRTRDGFAVHTDIAELAQVCVP